MLGVTLGSVRRLSGFALTVVGSTVVGLISMPLLIVGVGATAWAHFALAQSVAMFVSVLVSFGWGATGPSTVASLSNAHRPQFYASSFVARTVLYVVAVPVMTTIMALLLGGSWMFAGLAAVSLLLPAVSGSWFFIGESRPIRLLLCDALPQMIGTLAGTFSTLLTGSMTSFFLAQLAGNLCAVLLSLRAVTRGRSVIWLGQGWRGVGATLWHQRHGVWTTTATTLYVTLPSMLVQVFLPASLPAYAFAERLYRYASVAYSPVQQFLQGWVPAEGDGQLRRRVRSASLLAVVLGGLGAAALVGLSGLASLLLTGGQIDVPLPMMVAFAVAFVAVTVSGTVGLACLVALKQLKALSFSSWIGALIGVPALVVSAANGQDARLVAWAVALAEATVAVAQLLFLRRALSAFSRTRGL